MWGLRTRKPNRILSVAEQTDCIRRAVKKSSPGELSDGRRAKTSAARTLFSNVTALFENRSEDTSEIGGASEKLLVNQLRSVGYSPKKVEMDEEVIAFDCTLQDGKFPFSVIAFQTDTKGEYWRCALVKKFDFEYDNTAMNDVNHRMSWVKFHDGYGFPAIQADFLLLDSSEINIRAYLLYWKIQMGQFVEQYLLENEEASFAGERIFRNASRSLLYQFLNKLNELGPESGPKLQKLCETCAGKGHIMSQGRRRTCTVCKGTGYVDSA